MYPMFLMAAMAGGPEQFEVVNKCPPKVVVVNRTPAGPLHSHTCPRCGTTWTHSDDSFGSVAAHTCPTCGFGPVWAKSSSAVRNPYTAPPTTYAPAGTYTLPAGTGGCPCGVCPAPQRRGVFR